MTPEVSARPTLIDTNYAVKKTLLDRLRCPKCMGVVTEGGNNLDCQKCGASYRVDRGIPVMVDAKDTHTVLKYLPFGAWKAVDALANALYARPMNIVIEIQKSL